MGDQVCIDFQDDKATLTERLSVSRGSRLVPVVSDGGPPYEDEAIIPLAKWDTLKGSLDSFQKPSADTALCFCIWIINMPHDLVDPVRRMAHSVSLQKHANELVQDDKVKRNLSEMRSHCLDYLISTEDFKTQGVSVRQPGQITTTVDPRKGLRIGIHMDSWDRRAVLDRSSARNRLNVNLGMGSRFLLFGTTPISEIANQLGAERVSEVGPTDLARQWYRQNPEAPIYRIEIRPNEAYIAPTEFLPHDSTTESKNRTDISFTMLGHFRGPTKA